MYQDKVEGNQTAYNLAVSDFCKSPEVKKCDSSAYTGLVGQEIRIRAIDDFKVLSVSVLIKSSGGTTLEEGEALLADNGVDWIYTSTIANPALAGTKILVTATDIPGNEGTEEFIL